MVEFHGGVTSGGGTLYLLAHCMRFTVRDSGLCCVCVTSFELELTPLFVDCYSTALAITSTALH